ncbi:MAG: carbohydrate binding family 9 domain-containing protein [Bacteroidetes bacterium]|nr:carbohydrate binding family 9 domain-containing protein [Bacteroidota bacterium]
MKNPVLLSIALLLFISQFTFADNDSIPKRKEYFTSRATKTPKIDGLLDDETWKTAPIISDFKQNFPNYGVDPTQTTNVQIVYDNTAIYIAAFLYDSCSDSICKQLGNRDDYLNADNFRVVFDTYNTEQDAFDFSVTASGVQSDSRFSDYLYNAVWESAVKLHPEGWSVEIKIPYSALRFPSTKTQKWGMQITRSLTRNGEFDQWGLLPRGVPNPFKYWGYLMGMENIKQPIRLSLTPYITAYTSHYPANIEGESNYSSNITGGMDLKYGLNESFTVDATLLPDFTQVQSDNVVKNLSAFEQQFEEQRPFFQESTDLFQKGDLFYSRRIGRRPSAYYDVYDQTQEKEIIVKNPDQAKLLNATKVSGRTPNGLGIGLLNAVMDNTYAIAKDSLGNERKILTEPFSNYNIVVFDQQMKNSSSAYLINTNVKRNNNGRNADVTGGGFNVNNKKNTYFLTARGAMSNVFTKTDTITNQYTDLFGFQYLLSGGKNSGWFQFELYQVAINPTFNINDLGITRETNFINRGINFGFNRFQPWRSFLKCEFKFVV